MSVWPVVVLTLAYVVVVAVLCWLAISYGL